MQFACCAYFLDPGFVCSRSGCRLKPFRPPEAKWLFDRSTLSASRDDGQGCGYITPLAKMSCNAVTGMSLARLWHAFGNHWTGCCSSHGDARGSCVDGDPHIWRAQRAVLCNNCISNEVEDGCGPPCAAAVLRLCTCSWLALTAFRILGGQESPACCSAAFFFSSLGLEGPR